MVGMFDLGLFPGGGLEHRLFHALLRQDEEGEETDFESETDDEEPAFPQSQAGPTLDDVIEEVKRDGTWPDSFVYDLKELNEFRSYYDAERLGTMSLQEQEQVHDLEGQKTMDLLDQVNDHAHEEESAQPELVEEEPVPEPV